MGFLASDAVEDAGAGALWHVPQGFCFCFCFVFFNTTGLFHYHHTLGHITPLHQAPPVHWALEENSGGNSGQASRELPVWTSLMCCPSDGVTQNTQQIHFP